VLPPPAGRRAAPLFQVPEFPVLAVLGYYGKVPGEVDQVCALGEEIN